MSCIFRVSEYDFDVDIFLAQSSLRPDKVWRKGEHKTPKNVYEWSGFQLVASEAEMGNPLQQMSDAIEFLRLHRVELAKLKNFVIEGRALLDFGIEDRDNVLQCDRLSPELLRLAGNLGIGIEIMRY